MGCIGWVRMLERTWTLDISPRRTASHVQITSGLLLLEAVAFCQTSLAQTLLFGENNNNILAKFSIRPTKTSPAVVTKEEMVLYCEENWGLWDCIARIMVAIMAE